MNAMKKLILTAIAAAAIVSCSDWTQTEPLEPVVRYPWQESPQLWEEYKASVREYKERDHSIIYARLENSPEKVTNEKHFLRSLPDLLHQTYYLRLAEYCGREPQLPMPRYRQHDR